MLYCDAWIKEQDTVTNDCQCKYFIVLTMKYMFKIQD